MSSCALRLTVLLSLVACALAAAQAARASKRYQAALWLVVVLIVPAEAALSRARTAHAQSVSRESVAELAAWAEASTWGSATFLFPDSNRQNYAGLFRALSQRALWVDWLSGALAGQSQAAASEWCARWNQTMRAGFSPQHLQGMLTLPIDYYVLDHKHSLYGIKSVWSNRDFVVYDSEDLRRAASLRLGEVSPLN